MKRITLLFIAIIACLVTAAAQADTSAIQPSVTDTQIEYTDTPASTTQSPKKQTNNNDAFFSSDFRFDSATTISVVAIVSVFGLPVIIVFIAFYFRYKDKKAKYKLAEQALAAGQPIPEEFFRGKNDSNSTLQKGITNIFTGIGLFIFLWAITTQFSIGCIGLLIMFMGFGQVVIHYTNEKKQETKKQDNKDNNISIEE